MTATGVALHKSSHSSGGMWENVPGFTQVIFTFTYALILRVCLDVKSVMF